MRIRPSTKRKAIAAASIAVFLFVILSLMINTAMFFRCKMGQTIEEEIPDQVRTGDVGGSCNPFSDESMVEKVVDADENAKAIGAAQQFMLALDVPNTNTMYEANKKYAYCLHDDAPADSQIHRCRNPPAESDITSAIQGYRPYPQGALSAVSEELPLLQGFTHTFELTRGDTTLLQDGDQGGAQLQSRFIFAVPIPGGENIELKLEMSKGNVATGVTDQ